MVSDTDVMLAGACDEDNTYSTVRIYSIPTQEVSDFEPMLQERIGQAMHKVGDVVYVFGGYNFSSGDLASCENIEYSKAGSDADSTWASLPRLSEPMPLASLVRMKKVIYIIGACSSTVNSFDVM
jgi:hypothetical protein